jgi:hypothetical protein
MYIFARRLEIRQRSESTKPLGKFGQNRSKSRKPEFRLRQNRPEKAPLLL